MKRKIFKTALIACLSSGIFGVSTIPQIVKNSKNIQVKNNSNINSNSDFVVKDDTKQVDNFRYLSDEINVPAKDILKTISGQEPTGTFKVSLVKEFQDDNIHFVEAYHIIGSEDLKTQAGSVYEINPTITLPGVGTHDLTRITNQCFTSESSGKIIISSTLTHMYRAFNDSNIQGVDFSKATSLKIIGDNSFDGCNNLTEIKFTNTPKLEKIETEAFSDCSSLSSIDFSGATSLNSIGCGCFTKCSVLGGTEDGLKINCPSLKYIDEKAFSWINLKKLDLSNTGVIKIGANAFEKNVYLTNVVLPTTLERLYKGAFTECKTLSTINLHECSNLSRIDGGAFHECDLTGSLMFPENLEQIGNNSFSSNIHLNSIDLSKCNKLSKIDAYAFSKCSALSGELFIPSSVKFIGAEAFDDRDNNFANIYFNWTVSQLTDISDPIDLASDWYPNNIAEQTKPQIHVLKDTAQYYYGLDNFFEKDGVQIDDNPWIDPTQITQGDDKTPFSHETLSLNANQVVSCEGSVIQGNATLDIYTNVDGIESYILTSLHITNSSHIDSPIYINDTYNNKKITAISSQSIEFDTQIQNLILPNGLKFIGKNAFSSYTTINFVDFSKCKQLESIGESAFEHCSITAANINEATNLITIGYKAFYSSDLQGIQYFDPNNKEELDLSNLTQLKSIGGTSFWGCFNDKGDGDPLMKLILPKNLEYIGGAAFSRSFDDVYTSKIKLIDMTQCKSLKEIGNRTFYLCKNLETVLDSARPGIVGLPENIEKLGENVFGYTKLSGELIVPKNLTRIEKFAFERTNLSKIDFSLAKNLKYIGEGAFNRNYNLTSINLEKATALETIGESESNAYDYSYVFGGCKSLTGDLGIPNSVKYIDSNVFSPVNNPDQNELVPGPTFSSVHLYWTLSHLSLNINENNSIKLNSDWYPQLTNDAKVYIVGGSENLYPELNGFPQEWLNRFPADPDEDLYSGIAFTGEYRIDDIVGEVNQEYIQDFGYIVSNNIRYCDSTGTFVDVAPNKDNFSFKVEAEDGTNLSKIGITFNSNGQLVIKANESWEGNIRIIFTEARYGYSLKTSYFHCKIAAEPSKGLSLGAILGIVFGCLTLIGIIILIIILVKKKKAKKSKTKK